MKRLITSTTSALVLAAALVALSPSPAYAQGVPPAQVGRLCGIAAGVIDHLTGIVPDAVLQWALGYYTLYCV